MNVLFLGAHTDDIEHGAGGALSRFIRTKKHNLSCFSFSSCKDLERNKDIDKDIARVKDFLNESGIKYSVFDFPNRRFHEKCFEIRYCLEEIKEKVEPELVFVHAACDIHQDHQTIYQETFRVFRNVSVLGYECIRSCPDFSPNFFMQLSKEDLDNKLSLVSMYKTQGFYYNSEQSLRSLSIFRGTQSNTIFAEAYSVIRYIEREREAL